jgi:dihydrofolate reductase
MEKNSFKEYIQRVTIKDKNIYKNTRNQVLIMSEKLYLSLNNISQFFRNRLTIVLTKHPNMFLDNNSDNYIHNINKYNNERTDIIFTNNENIHNVLLKNRENLIIWYPILIKNYKIFILDDE